MKNAGKKAPAQVLWRELHVRDWNTLFADLDTAELDAATSTVSGLTRTRYQAREIISVVLERPAIAVELTICNGCHVASPTSHIVLLRAKSNFVESDICYNLLFCCTLR